MTPAASTEEIRAAYRALARRLHPDRMGGASPTERALAERRMREINESWEVLQDPARRRAYDAERLASPRRPTAASAPAPARPQPDAGRGTEADGDLVDVGGGRHLGLPRHLPWVVLLVVFGVIFVLSAYAGSGGGEPSDAPAATVPAVVGACLDVAPGPSTTIVPCDGPHELEVVARASETERCPDGTERRRLSTDGMLDCVRAGPAPAPTPDPTSD